MRTHHMTWPGICSLNLSSLLRHRTLKSFQPLRRFILNMINCYLNCLFDGTSLITSMFVLSHEGQRMIQKWIHLKFHVEFRWSSHESWWKGEIEFLCFLALFHSFYDVRKTFSRWFDRVIQFSCFSMIYEIRPSFFSV